MRPAAVLLLWSSTIAFSRVIPRRADRTASPLPVETWRDENNVSAKFVSVCDGCFDGNDSSFIFELSISTTDAVCGEPDIVLNDKKLDLEWDGTSGIGSGIFPADLTNGTQKHELVLNYESLCITSPEDSIEEYTAQILTVTFHPSNQSTDHGESGFAVSFNSAGTPQIFRLVASPVEISDEDGFDSWIDPTGSPISSGSIGVPEKTLNNDGLEADLKRLNALKLEAHELQEEIRQRLLRDCSSITSKLKQCDSLKCFITASIKIVPDIFRVIRYRFGPLPSSLSDNPCRPSPRVAHGNTRPRPEKNSTIFDLKPNDIASTTSQDTPELSPPLSNSPILTNPTLRSPTKLFVKDLAIILLVAATLFLIARQCRNSPSCRRRRVDLAARREERRTRTAYRNAARRYRWRQWWNTQLGIPTPSNNPHDADAQNRLTRVDEEEQAQHRHPNSNPQAPDEGPIQAEILGFRRVLEFVGELVRPDDDNQRSSSNSRRQISQLPPGGGRSSTPAPSSTAPLTTIGSPRTSTVLSYETDSSVTLDSLDPETATMISS
ncbi:hypothetical protein FQN55_005082 [Onygenales sp. PD_40]|nr:hypothetical protein FQN55_005082 [Onygenales sp. PD_40]KAK2782098.1 hypothetical protein FQN53_000191 [Emmonsiellopsis sp. PD_33]KAK2783598.1 hypothetical protein FQN52_009525 [Onygenales sp. PD_12]KAK2794461.1 hypothetical protein FQN51_000825 [Onygenales sp. PD_10]